MELKKANPDLPILIRECSDVHPKLWARYGECEAPGWGKTRVQEEPKVKQKLVETGTQDFSLAFDLVAVKKIYIRRVIGCFVYRINSSAEVGAALPGTGNSHFVIQNRFQFK